MRRRQLDGWRRCSSDCLIGQDDDGDGTKNSFDNCPTVYNPNQRDTDDDHVNVWDIPVAGIELRLAGSLDGWFFAGKPSFFLPGDPPTYTMCGTTRWFWGEDAELRMQKCQDEIRASRVGIDAGCPLD